MKCSRFLGVDSVAYSSCWFIARNSEEDSLFVKKLPLFFGVEFGLISRQERI